MSQPMSEDNAAGCTASIIIPVFNTAAYLPACLDSVLAQTEASFECILVDDGSTDGSLEIERSYAARDSRFRVIEQPHLRQGAARNRGLAEARGEYIYYMDSDDIIEPNLLEICCRQCDEDELDFVIFDAARFIDSVEDAEQGTEGVTRYRRDLCPHGIVSGEAFWIESFPKSALPLVCWAQLFRRSYLESHSILFCEDIFYEDCDWTLRIYMHARRVRYLPIVLYYYRDRAGSVVNSLLTQVHAASSIEEHRILCELLQAAPQSQASMVRESSDQVDYLFCRFHEFEPSRDFIDQTVAFGESLARTVCDPDTDSARRTIDARSLLALCGGTISWPIPRFTIPGWVIPELMFPGILTALSGESASIYGTGLICSHLVRYLDEGLLPKFFINSKDAGDRTFMGKPIKPISEVGGLGLSSIIIASALHYRQMSETALRYVPSASLILPDTPLIKRLLEQIETGAVRIES